jgi:hypothetical protein
MSSRSSIILLFLLLSGFTGVALEPVTIRSRSGQFLLRGLPLNTEHFGGTTNGLSYVRLDPRVFAVSCERIKEAVLSELGMTDHWRGMIAVVLHPTQYDHEPIEVTSTRYKNNWGYRMDIPERVDRRQVIKALVEVLLLEVANRKAGTRSAELPPWLAQGLTSHLEATSLANISLEPETSLVKRERHPDPLKEVRESLRSQPALNFNELSLPHEELLSEPHVRFYGLCAHLFVHELLQFKDGRRCLQEMTLRLPEHLNWQTAFLKAFANHFPRLLEADKWWSLVAASYQGKESSMLWSQTETWRQLESILSTAVDVRLRPEELPIKTTVKLQNILMEWDYLKQFPVLRLKINHLQALRLRVSPGMEPLLDGYRSTLEFYLQKRGEAVPDNGKLKRGARKAIDEAVKRLNELDLRREEMQRPTDRPATAQAEPVSDRLRPQ